MVPTKKTSNGSLYYAHTDVGNEQTNIKYSFFFIIPIDCLFKAILLVFTCKDSIYLDNIQIRNDFYRSISQKYIILVVK